MFITTLWCISDRGFNYYFHLKRLKVRKKLCNAAKLYLKFEISF